MARLPDDSELAKKMEQKFIDILYKDLPHPPSAYITNFPIAAPISPSSGSANASAPVDEPDYAYRSSDGSNYNVLIPNMGRAGMPYARSVPALNTTPPSALPDPGLVFDSLLKVCVDPSSQLEFGI
jgi:linoleate 10R-lipoxygenase